MPVRGCCTAPGFGTEMFTNVYKCVPKPDKYKKIRVNA